MTLQPSGSDRSLACRGTVPCYTRGVGVVSAGEVIARRPSCPRSESMADKTLADRAKLARETLRRRVTDLNVLLDQQTNILEFAQEALITELTGGVSASNNGRSGVSIRPEGVRMLKEVTGALATAADTKVRLAKAQKVLGEALSTDQLLEGAKRMIAALPPNKRAKFLRDLRALIKSQAPDREEKPATQVVASVLEVRHS